MLIFLALVATVRAGEPTELACCDEASARSTLTSYLRIQRALVENDPKWSGHIQAWFGRLRKHGAAAASSDERAVYTGLEQTVRRVQSTWNRDKALAGWSEVGLGVAWLVLHHPGGDAQVAEARCGDDYWLQEVDEPLTPLREGSCEPEWVNPPPGRR